ncbi:MAG: glycerol kinase GlpK [Clostridia bacterium]|nr:glycerol kinase GlpK [Clostridia bacterium]
MKKYILAIDEGTTSARSILFDQKGNIVGVAQKEFAGIYPQAGFVEQNPMEIYASQYATMTEVVLGSGISPDEIAAIGITNQRETTVCWEKSSGKPVYNAIVWQCRRTAPFCEELKSRGLTDYVKEKTGLLIDAYFSATKIKWILDNVEGAREKAEKGDLLFGTIDSWLIYKLTEGRLHITDYTNASRTMLFDIKNLCWDKRLLSELSIPESVLPRVVSSSEVYAKINFMGAEIPISGIAGDQQAALFGQCCFNEGEAKNTYGTGCFLLMHSGQKVNCNSGGILTTVAATLKGEPTQYAYEGSVFVGGAVIQWLRDEMGLIDESKDSEYFAKKVKDSGGVYVVPAFSGLGAPYWDMYARGTIVGLSRGTGRNHIIRACLEAIAYQTDDLLFALKDNLSAPLNCLKVDGGASANNLLMQFQSDISGIKIQRNSSCEATALGAAFLAGLAVGFWKNKDELISLKKDVTEFTPQINNEKREVLIRGWKKAVEKAKGWEEA